ncbi:cytochrome P450 [Trichoderma longibrachiatum]
MTGPEGVRAKGRIPKYRTSCDNCQTAKVKCGHEKPSCRRCSVHRVDCVYSLSRRMGRPRAKKVAADASNHGPSAATSEQSGNANPKAVTPEDAAEGARPPQTLAAEGCGAEAEPAEPLVSEAGQIPENWAPLFGDLGQLNATEAMDGLEGSEQQEDDPMEFLSTESPMELGDMAFDGIPSFLNSLSGSLEPQATTSTVPAELFGSHEMLSFALPDASVKGDHASARPSTHQQHQASSSSESCTCGHSAKPSRRDSASAPSARDESNQLPNLASILFSEASYSPQEPSDTSPSVQTSCDGHSSEPSWRRTQVVLRRGNCSCMATITERIASLKAEQQSSCFMPMDCVLMLEQEVQESLSLLHECRNCRLDSVVHLLALVSVRMMLNILQKTARSEFVSRPTSPSGGSVPGRVRCRFLRKALQARFHKLAALVEERESLVTGKKQDSFSKSASLLLVADGVICDQFELIWVAPTVTSDHTKPMTPVYKSTSKPQDDNRQRVNSGDVAMEPSHLHNTTATTTLGYKLQSALDRPFATAAVTILISIVSIAFLDWLNYQHQRSRLGKIPIVGDAPYLWKRLRWTENESNLKGVFQRGYDTFSKKLKPWAYWGQHDDFILVLPPGTCDEVKNADPSQMSFLQAVEDSYHFRLHTNILGRAHVDAVRQSVNKNMNQEPFAGFLQIWHLVHLVAASFLIGPHFARDPDYMGYIEDYCLNVPHFVHLYFWVPAPLRKLFWYLSPWGFRVRRVIKNLKSFIIPELKRRIADWRANDRNQSPDQYTLLRAMLDLKEERGQFARDATAMTRQEEERQINIFSDEVMFTAFDSAGPVACLVTQLLFESIQDPSLTEALRAEISKALADNGGEWSVQMMSSLPRLESFTRETLRVDGPTLFSVTRSILKPFQLKSGLVLRPGNIISAPSWMIHNDEDNYPNAKQFNPYRFYDETTNTATVKATTASNTFLAYGYGSQMCPGRYLGVRMTQIIFAKLLMRYDATFEGGKRTKPENIVMPGQVLPSYYSKIVLKLREGGEN